MSKINIKQVKEDPVNYGYKLPVPQLVKLLKKLSDVYYNTGKTLVSDKVFDSLEDVLRERDPSNIYFNKVGAPVTKDKVKLPYFMASLDKIKSEDKLDAWIDDYSGPYVVSDKLDGVSALLVFDNGSCKMYTRGDGEYGLDISHLVKYVVPKCVNTTVKTVVRGELVISKKDFENIKDSYANGRATVSGLVNSKNYSEDVANITKFIGYSVVCPKMDAISQMETIKNTGLPTVYNKVVDKLDVKILSDMFVDRRVKSVYDVDGVVVVDSSKVYNLQNKNPTYGFAYKEISDDQIAEVEVVDVVWNASMYGYLKPKIKIKPVELGGVTIDTATGFNGKFILDNKIGPGAVVKLVRSGDVIPHIMKVVKQSEPKMPNVPYKWTKTKVDIVVKDIHGSAKDSITVKQITHFFKQLDVSNISSGTVSKLVEAGYDDIFKIISAKKSDLVNIDGVGEKTVDKIYKNIDEGLKNADIVTLMAASGVYGRGVGKKRIKMVVDVYPDILTVNTKLDILKDKIMMIDGFDDITASQFIEGLPEFKKFYMKLKKITNVECVKKDEKVDTTFKGMKIVFTGFRDTELQKFIENRGGAVVGSVSKNTDILVYVDTKSSKYKKAVELKVTTMSKQLFSTTFVKK